MCREKQLVGFVPKFCVGLNIQTGGFLQQGNLWSDSWGTLTIGVRAQAFARVFCKLHLIWQLLWQSRRQQIPLCRDDVKNLFGQAGGGYGGFLLVSSLCSQVNTISKSQQLYDLTFISITVELLQWLSQGCTAPPRKHTHTVMPETWASILAWTHTFVERACWRNEALHDVCRQTRLNQMFWVVPPTCTPLPTRLLVISTTLKAKASCNAWCMFKMLFDRLDGKVALLIANVMGLCTFC